MKLIKVTVTRGLETKSIYLNSHKIVSIESRGPESNPSSGSEINYEGGGTFIVAENPTKIMEMING